MSKNKEQNKNNCISINNKKIVSKRPLQLNDDSDDDLDNNVEEFDIQYDNSSENEEKINLYNNAINTKNQKSNTIKNKEKPINTMNDISDKLKSLSTQANDGLDVLTNIAFIFDENNDIIKEKINEDSKKNINLENKIYSILKDKNTVNNLISSLNFDNEENKINSLLYIGKYIYIRLPYVFPSNKVCDKCSKILPVSNFKLFNTTKDGLKKICINCDNEKKNTKKRIKSFIKVDSNNIDTPPNLTINDKKQLKNNYNKKNASLNSIHNNEVDEDNSDKLIIDTNSDNDSDSNIENKNKETIIKKKNKKQLSFKIEKDNI